MFDSGVVGPGVGPIHLDNVGKDRIMIYGPFQISFKEGDTEGKVFPSTLSPGLKSGFFEA